MPLSSMDPYSASTGTSPGPDRLAALAVLGRPGGPHAPADDGALLDLGDLGGRTRWRPRPFQKTSTTSPTLTTTWSTNSPTEGRTEMTSSWTTSTRELTEMPRPMRVTSASVCSSGWSTPGTLVIRPLQSCATARTGCLRSRTPPVGNGSRPVGPDQPPAPTRRAGDLNARRRAAFRAHARAWVAGATRTARAERRAGCRGQCRDGRGSARCHPGGSTPLGAPTVRVIFAR